MSNLKIWRYGLVAALLVAWALFSLGIVWAAIYSDVPSVRYGDPMEWSQLERHASQLEWRGVLSESPMMLGLLLSCTGLALVSAFAATAARRRVILVLVQSLLLAPLGALGLVGLFFMALSPWTGGLHGEAATEGWIQDVAFGVLFAFSGCSLGALLLGHQKEELMEDAPK